MQAHNRLARSGIRCTWLAGLAALAFSGLVGAQTNISHSAIGHFVPEKRIRVEATVSDPKGIKLARTYFKVGTQADYLLVPMTAAGGNRYSGIIPAPNASAGSLEYVVLAVNGEGEVSRTPAYTASARRGGDTPPWQNVSSDGQIKVFTEVADVPQSTAMFSDSVALDVVESTARFGGVAGLSGGGGAGGSSLGTTTAGGMSTAAIAGGVALAAGAVAAAASSGGGGDGGSSAPPTNIIPQLVGNWSGTQTGTFSLNCPTDPSQNGTCNFTIPFSGTVNSAGVFSGTQGTGSVSCSGPGIGAFSEAINGGDPIPPFTINPTGGATLPPAIQSQSGVTVNCSGGAMTFTAAPRRMSGSQSCTGTLSGSGLPTCNFNFSINFTGQ